MATEVVRAKGLMDGATTLAEAAEKLREGAAMLDGMVAQRWELEQPVEDDFAFIVKRRREPTRLSKVSGG